jgi:hypothetical protein
LPDDATCKHIAAAVKAAGLMEKAAA